MGSDMMASGKGGYDCDFVEDPPKRLECPICLQTVREPHVISCCGHQFCRLCIEQVRFQGRPCPLCNEPSFTLFLHKGVEREVKALRVRCPQKELGCEWVGELGGLERHVSPGAGPLASAGRDEGCQYAEVECLYQCGECHQRRFILQHETEFCTRRPVEAQLANVTRNLQEAREDNVSLREELVRMKEQQTKQEEERNKLSQRLDTILKTVKAESNSLSEELYQAEVELSQLQEKLEAEIEKKTRALSEMLEERKEEAQSLGEELVKVKELSESSEKRVREEQRKQEERATAELTEIKKEMKQFYAEMRDFFETERKERQRKDEELEAKQEEQLKTVTTKYDFLESRLTPTAPFLFTILNFEHFKKHYCMKWYCEPFYSHPQGYKLCVGVYPGGCGNGKDTHMSVYIHIMRGEYDDSLKWPFLGSVIIQLFHRPTETWRDMKVIAFRELNSDTQRPVGCIRNSGHGYARYMRNTELKDYTDEWGNNLRFCIFKVELLQ